jgi:hypothetical protein
MLQPYPTALAASRILLRLMRVLNLLLGAAIVALVLPASFVFEPQFIEFFSKQPPRIDPGWLMPALRAWMVLALPMVAAVHVALSRLLDVVETVRAGDPFVPVNATRLMTIAWCVLVTQLLELVYGVMAATVNAAGSHVEWKFSLTGWVAVVLLFVLARVFEVGTRMREDLEAMI